jgi:hypothetical protein
MKNYKVWYERKGSVIKYLFVKAENERQAKNKAGKHIVENCHKHVVFQSLCESTCFAVEFQSCGGCDAFGCALDAKQPILHYLCVTKQKTMKWII